jgi:hypothetical protein
MVPGPQFSHQPEARKLSTADSSQNNAGHAYLKLFSMECCLSPRLFQKAFRQLLV